MTEPRLRGLFARLTVLAVDRRGRVLAAWVVMLVAAVALAPLVGGDYDVDYSTPGSESAAAGALLTERFPGQSGDTVDVVWTSADGARDPAVKPRIAALVERATELPGIGGLQGPPDVSDDGQVGLARLELDRPAWDVPPESGRHLIALARGATGDGLRVEVGGSAIEYAEAGGSPEAIGLIAAGVILLVAFGSVVAAGLPLVVALAGLGVSASLTTVLSAVIDVPEWAPAIAGLIGIGVGVDYALLVVTRFRSALASGADARSAAIEAARTAGRSVLVAGSVVMLSLLGLLLVGFPYLRGVALSSSLAVLVVMAASVTLLPALLAFCGHRVNRLRITRVARAPRAGRASPALAWSRAVQRRPRTAAIAGVAALLALTAPVLGLRLGVPDAGNDAVGSPTRQAFDLVAAGFGPGANGQLVLAARLPDDRAADAFDHLAGEIRRLPGVDSVSPPRVDRDRRAGVLAVVPDAAPQDPATVDLLHRLRRDTIPAAMAASGATVHVGGLTAAIVDQSEALAARLPLFVGGVLCIAFVLLVAAFRAPVVALKAGVLNLLSVGAAYGVVALVAEGGAVGELVGIAPDTPVPPFIPVVMFAVLFGLSMDYEVFLLSRVREDLADHEDTSRAVTSGIAKTARVITAAATIMVAVFLAFVASPEVFLRLMGIGMATAILIDATIVRMVLVPALMQLMGWRNWWIPRWLDAVLPRLGDTSPI